MYELTRLSFHNWYVFEVLDLDVTGMIAVIGPTGAGKSAILDGIQVIITGNNGNFIDLNPSAGEKSDRLNKLWPGFNEALQTSPYLTKADARAIANDVLADLQGRLAAQQAGNPFEAKSWGSNTCSSALR